MIVSCFTAMIFFKGFATESLTEIESTIVNSEKGHLQIADRLNWSNDFSVEKNQIYISQPENLIQQLESIPEVKIAAGRINSYVLFSTSEKSVGGYVIGYDHNNEPHIEKNMNLITGGSFSNKNPYEIIMGDGLRKLLDLKVGQTVSLVGQSLTGSMTSLDLEVRGFFSTGLTEIDNSITYITLEAAQKLLNTDRVEKISILLKEGRNLPIAFEKVQNVLKNNPSLQVKSWKQTSTFFNEVSAFYKIQNLLVEIILSVLIFFGLLNTLGMSIYERIGEFGTLRALGDQFEDVFILIFIETAFLSLIGIFIALPVSFAVTQIFNLCQVKVLMPGASTLAIIQIVPSLIDFFQTGMVIMITCIMSILFPFIKALKLSITDSLRFNS